jgi:cytochrome c peroxidase
MSARRKSLLMLSAGLLLIGLAAGLLSRRPPPAWHWTPPAGISTPPIPADNPITAAKVELGRRLFYDADLSANGTMSCATCQNRSMPLPMVIALIRA